MMSNIEYSNNGTTFRGIERDQNGNLIIPNDAIIVRFIFGNEQVYCPDLSLILGDKEKIDTTDLERCVTPYTDGGASIDSLAQNGYSRFIPLNINGQIINYGLNDQDSVLNDFNSLTNTANYIYTIVNSGNIEYLNQVINETIQNNQIGGITR